MAVEPAQKAPALLATPSPQQIAWQRCELGMFIHFNMFTFSAFKWRNWKTPYPVANVFNPAKLDTDQWMEAANAFGAKYAVLTAKHCDGFCLWPTRVPGYEYSVKNTTWRGGKGDVVGDFVKSCRKHGIHPGLYYSVAANGYQQVDNPGKVNRGRGGDPVRQQAYNRLCLQQLSELWSNYGELFHIWFDGGALTPNQGGPDMVPLLKRLQPNANVFSGPAATVRWVGNENGVAGYPCWASVPDQILSDKLARSVLVHGDPDGQVWMPGECDVPVRKDSWGWQPGQEKLLHSVNKLMNMYTQSVGRNCNLLLNSNPDRDGLIPQVDMRRYKEFGQAIRARFGAPLPGNVQRNGNVVELELHKPARVDRVVIREDIALGHRVRAYELQGQAEDGTWRVLASGSSIGHKRIEMFAPLTTSRIRLLAKKIVLPPAIATLCAFA